VGEIFERVIPERALEWTGERLTTASPEQVEIEHLHRYFLVRVLCRGLDVLDVAAGEGYGSALLAQTARSVTGVEVSAEAVAHAVDAYRRPNLRFLQGDARRLPLDDASVDVVVSFETIEHFYEHDQFLGEVRRVLRPGGRFISSSPERDVYSPSGSSANPYHVRELSRAEFKALLCNSFAYVHLLGQRPMLGSALVSDGDTPGRSLTFEKRGPRHFEAVVGLPRPVYFVAVASDRPVDSIPDSLYIETAEIGAALNAAGVAEASSAENQKLRERIEVAERAQTEMRAHILASRADAESARAQAATACTQYDVARAEADSARDETAAARAAAAAACAERDVARAEADSARDVTVAARAEAATACAQRDIARIAARRAAAASEGQWRWRITELNRSLGQAEQRASQAEQRASQAEQQAAEWRVRYEQLRGRLEALLRRFWILRFSRLIPARGRRFLRDRLLGWGRL
jgi:SAM-dependent methyltransferase